jgi:hypothetical protein
MIYRINNDTRQPCCERMVFWPASDLARRQLALALPIFEQEFSKPEVQQVFLELQNYAGMLVATLRERELAIATAEWLDSPEEEPCAR